MCAAYSNDHTLKNGNGKRERVDQEDDPEFMPLSKRINNIHLSPERLINGGHALFNRQSQSTSHHNNIGVPNSELSHSSDYPSLPPDGFSIEPLETNTFVHVGNGFHPQHSLENNPGPSIPYHPSMAPVPTSANFISNTSQIHHPHLSQVPGFISHPAVSPRMNTGDFQYRPSLSQNANPYYYESNRALFNLYIERQLRNNQCPHPEAFNRIPNSSNNPL